MGVTSARYVVKIDLRGVAGVVAPITGKQIPMHLGFKSCTCIPKTEGPLFEDGPVWRIATTSATWPRSEAAPSQSKESSR